MSDPGLTTEEMIVEIHGAIVKKTPSHEDLRKAAQDVVDCMWGPNRSKWEDLKKSVMKLDDVLEGKT